MLKKLKKNIEFYVLIVIESKNMNYMGFSLLGNSHFVSPCTNSTSSSFCVPFIFRATNSYDGFTRLLFEATGRFKFVHCAGHTLVASPDGLHYGALPLVAYLVALRHASAVDGFLSQLYSALLLQLVINDIGH